MNRTFVILLTFLCFSSFSFAKQEKYYNGKIKCENRDSVAHKGYLEITCLRDKTLDDSLFRVLSYLHIGFTCKKYGFHEMIEQMNSDLKVFRIIKCLKSDLTESGEKNQSAENTMNFMTDICRQPDKDSSEEPSLIAKDKEARKLCKKLIK